MPKPEINVTPLIDVLLVLLIIFMVVTPMKPSSFDARIPQEPKDGNSAPPDPRMLVVVYENNGHLRINGETTAATVDEPEELIARLKETFSLREGNGEREKTVFIKAPKGLDYGSVAKIIDAVKTGGADPVSLQIDDLE